MCTTLVLERSGIKNSVILRKLVPETLLGVFSFACPIGIRSYPPRESAVKTFFALPQASMIVIQGEYQHLILLPYGQNDLERDVAEFLLQQKKPPRLTVVEGKPLPLVP